MTAPPAAALVRSEIAPICRSEHCPCGTVWNAAYYDECPRCNPETKRRGIGFRGGRYVYED